MNAHEPDSNKDTQTEQWCTNALTPTEVSIELLDQIGREQSFEG